MVDSEYSPDNYKSSKISIGAIIKNPEMLRFVSDHLKTKKMCILSVDLNNINLDDANFDEDETITHVRLMIWRNRLKQCKAFKKI